jgi:serine/threonine-protein kinase
VWVVLFTIVVPSSPRKALIAALLSVGALPVIVGLVMASGASTVHLDALQFFFGFIFPYLLVVAMAYIGARIVYQLGSEVARARELGGYLLEDRLGEGAMGEVWKATHRMLARPAAIKIIRPELAGAEAGLSAEVRELFEREAKVIAQLRSPHTVHLFDYGVSTLGTFYYAMELLDGMDTDTLVRRFGPMPPERAIKVLRQMCHSLSEAQSHGLVHRDIKPPNIILCRYGEDFDFVKVLDFGLVHAIAGVADATLVDAHPRAIRGTPSFMAPEQVEGRDLDGRADIYATGCVAYWLLTGERLFVGEDASSVMAQHIGAEPPRPSDRSKHPIPRELDELILACLEKAPEDRPSSARELGLRLEALPGAFDWTQDRAREWWARAETPAN